MRDRLLEFLPLLLALGLIAAWFGFQQPLPWLSQAQQAPESQTQKVVQSSTPTPTTGLSRATAIQSLCDSRQPRFLGTLANLKARLGSSMGDPLECERPVDAEGNTQQLTTRGLAYYRRDLDVAVFTNGWDHWALSDTNELLHWAGSEVEPPAAAKPVT